MIMTAKNWMAYAHWRQCRAVGMSEAEKRDPTVRRNAAIIEEIVREFERQDSARQFAESFAMLLVKK